MAKSKSKEIVLRGVFQPTGKHLEVIEYLLKPSKEIKQVDLVCGRGFGKSVLAIVVAFMALCSAPNMIGLFLEPDTQTLNRVFLKKWKQIIPKDLYVLNKSERTITMFNGSLLYYGIRNITGSKGMSEDSQLGQDVSFVIDDEAARNCNLTFYQNTLACIRHPSKTRFYLTVSTPRVGMYQSLVSSPKHKLFRGRSVDNPYLPADYVSNLLSNMSKEQARRELDGEFIALEGKIWKEFSLDPWPHGNILSGYTFDPNKPFWLFADFGSATGSYIIVQAIQKQFLDGKYPRMENLWVACGEYCPAYDASASRAFQLIKTHYGTPLAITGGKDTNSRDKITGDTIAYFSKQVFGEIAIHPVREHQEDKQYQYDSLTYLICDTQNQRRFAILDKQNYKILDEDSKRGLYEMFDSDQFLPVEQRAEGEILPKKKSIIVQHVRDALLMGTQAVMRPPTWSQKSDYAK